MAKLFAVCGCGQRNEYHADDIEGLEDLIDDERDEAKAAAEGGRDDDDWLCPSALTGGARPLRELAVALRRRAFAEAERLLDVIARAFGGDAEEQVQQGRFSPEARRAA